MKRRLICLTLSILMLLPCILTGCSEKKTEEETGEVVDNSAKTITMWVVTEDETTEQAEKLVNEAVTKITKSKFKTNVVIQFCTEDEYYDKLEAAIEANETEIKLKEMHDKALRAYLRQHKGEKENEELKQDFYLEYPQYSKFQNVEEEDEEDAVVTEEETVVNDYGIVEIKYPDAKANQVDIFYLSGYDKYLEYYNNEWLSSLSEELSTSSKKLTDYISTSLLNGVQIDGGVYAIPNNVAIGEYTYMMIDKELFDLYKQKISNVQNVVDLSTFLNDVKNYNGEKTPDDADYVVPLASTFEECMRMLVWYWDVSYTDMTVYETYYDEEKGRNYVLQTEYDVVVETENKDGTTSTSTEKKLTSKVTPYEIYLTDENGNYVYKDGEDHGYHYLVDEEGGWVKTGDKDPKYDGKAKGAMYLVDNAGNLVKPDEDMRIIVDGDTAYDSYGNPKPTYDYSYTNNKSSDEFAFSILGSLQLDASKRNRGDINLGFNSLFTMTDYRELLTKLMTYEYNEYYGEVQDGQRAAVSFVKGDARVKLEYEENGYYVDPESGRQYYAIVAEYPEATEAELYGNMFAVYANSNHLARSMEVITYLNTNSEFRNLLQYGIEGQHYELEKLTDTDDQGVETEQYQVKLLPGTSEKEYGTYRMDIEKTGNCFIVTPTAEMGGPDAWVYAKKQNNDSLINPLLGFDFNQMTADDDVGLDITLIDQIQAQNEETWDNIRKCTNLEDLEYLLENDTNGLKKIYAASAGDVKLNKATNPAYDPSMPMGADGPEEQVADTSGSSPYTVYQNWLNQYGYAAGSGTARP